jgi:hypothetical protein
MSSQLCESDKGKSPILVTGAHRSGTTWVGKMLAASRQVAYVSEPLNVWHRPGVMFAPIQRWYTYICPENEASYLDALQDTLRLRYHLWAEVRSLTSMKDLLRMGRDAAIFWSGWVLHKRVLLKDPFAVFSVPWFKERLGCAVVVVVRHPAAFVSSLVRLGWSFDFADLLEQPLLMRDWLEAFRSEMVRVKDLPQDIIEQASLLWKVIYHTVWVMKAHMQDILLIRHEDLSAEPVEGFGRLYHALGLEFHERARRTVMQSSSAENPSEASLRKVHSVWLDSRASVHNWKRRLSREDIERVRRLTEEVACHYYSQEEWE